MKLSANKKIASIIGNEPLASDICNSINSALSSFFVHLTDGENAWDIFKHSLDAAIRDIEEHPRGKLFRRLIEYGPLNPEDPETLVGDGETFLSDPECGECVEFIYSHMINRFKGELAELLAMHPCITLIQKLQREKRLPSDIHLYWGETVQERRQATRAREGNMRWGSYTKGADGLLVEQIPTRQGKSHESLKIHGIVEVKSTVRSKKQILGQINNHIVRLSGGLKLQGREYQLNHLYVAFPDLIRIMVVPSTWKLSREWHSVKTDRGRELVGPITCKPPVDTSIEKVEPNLWKITLDWSQETLSQAAYEMTFWYMSQVGAHVYVKNNMPKGWEYMTPMQAGYNSIKMMLYYILLRHITKRQDCLATRLYNVYCFGYPLGADSKEMLWPDDFPSNDEKEMS